LPTVYIDTSVAIEYFIVEGVEAYALTTTPQPGPFEGPEQRAIRELIKSDARWNAMAAFRRAYLGNRDVATILVTSPLAVIELSEWYAETVFRSLCVDVAGPGAVQRRGKKDVGELIAKLVAEVDREQEGHPSDPDLAEARRQALRSMCIVPSFLESHGLRGVGVKDLNGFEVSQDFAYGVGDLLAHLQLGLADILHIHAAGHLRCKYFASFDSDFRRVKKLIEDEFSLSLLTSPEELRRAVFRA
jgi:hypothetical protein